MEKILVIGACGQIGGELTLALRQKYGAGNVIASDIKEEAEILKGTGPFLKLDIMNAEATRDLVKKLCNINCGIGFFHVSTIGESPFLWSFAKFAIGYQCQKKIYRSNCQKLKNISQLIRVNLRWQ